MFKFELRFYCKVMCLIVLNKFGFLLWSNSCMLLESYSFIYWVGGELVVKDRFIFIVSKVFYWFYLVSWKIKIMLVGEKIK